MFSYVVTCTFAGEEIKRSFSDWLQNTHIADVLAAGASRAELVSMDDGSIECRYVFSSRKAFEDYERNHAPRLRAQGLERAQGRVSFSRRTGEIL
jgi:hypothetical protein